MTFGEHLKAWREAAGLSQDDVAAAAGVRQQTVAGWERGREAGKNYPKPRRFAGLAAVLGITPDEIMRVYIETVADEPTERQPAPTRPVLKHMLGELLAWQERLSEQLRQVLRLVEDVHAELQDQTPTTPPAPPGPPSSRRRRPSR